MICFFMTTGQVGTVGDRCLRKKEEGMDFFYFFKENVMSVFKLVSITGNKSFSKSKIELIVHEKSVSEILAHIEKGKDRLASGLNHSWVQQLFFRCQSCSFDQSADHVIKVLALYPEEAEWVVWYSYLYYHNYEIRHRHLGEIQKVMKDIEVIEVPT